MFNMKIFITVLEIFSYIIATNKVYLFVYLLILVAGLHIIDNLFVL